TAVLRALVTGSPAAVSPGGSCPGGEHGDLAGAAGPARRARAAGAALSVPPPAGARAGPRNARGGRNPAECAGEAGPPAMGGRLRTGGTGRVRAGRATVHPNGVSVEAGGDSARHS